MKRVLVFLFAFLLVTAASGLSAQCYPDRHSTNFFDGWLSCEPAANPNPARPAGHFILYDFNKPFALGQMRLWNTNDPAWLTAGMRDVAIDVSLDGSTWTHIGDFVLEQGTGGSTYEGFAGPHLGGAEGRYLLITALSNYGGDCFGLSEMRVEGEEVIVSSTDDQAVLDCISLNLFPNPFADQILISWAPECAGPMSWRLYDPQGKLLNSRRIDLAAGQSGTYSLGADLPAGTYRLVVSFGGASIQRTLVKMNRS